MKSQTLHAPLKRDGATIDYKISGDGDVTLFFVHGSYIDQTYWSEQVNYFNSSYKLVTIDLPGHGLSGTDRKDWSIDGFVDDVLFVIHELQLKNVILIGHSLGADICLMAATREPSLICGFIAVEMFKNAGLALPQEFKQQVAQILENIKTDFENTNEQYVRNALLTPQTAAYIKDRIIHAYRNAWQPMGKATTPEVFELYKKEQIFFPKLSIKLFLLNVDYIPTNEDALKIAGNGYELIHLKGTCHFPMLEEPDALNEAIDTCLREIISNK